MRNPSGPKFRDSRDREFTVVLEDLRSQFRAFGEGLQDVRQKLGRVEEDVSILKDDVAILKVDVSSLKMNVSFINKALPTLATKDDLLALERRMVRLETAN